MKTEAAGLYKGKISNTLQLIINPYLIKLVTMPKPPSTANPADLLSIANPKLAQKLSEKENTDSDSSSQDTAASPAYKTFNKDIWAAVLALNVVRYVLAMVLIGLATLYFTNTFSNVFAKLEFPRLFLSSIVILVISAVGFTILTKFRLLPLSTILTLQFALDLVITGLLTHATGGLNSSFSWVFFIIVATGSVVLKRKEAIALASGAILIILYEYLYTTLQGNENQIGEHINIVLYSVALMASAWFISAIAQKIRHMDKSSYALGDESIEDYLVNEEIAALTSALEATAGNKTEAAKLVGMTFRSFRYKVSKYEIA